MSTPHALPYPWHAYILHVSGMLHLSGAVGREKHQALCQQNKYRLQPLHLPSGSIVIIIMHVSELNAMQLTS